MPKKVRKRIGQPAGRVYLGIDPGKQGGLATITQGGLIQSYDVMPATLLDLWKLISKMQGVHMAALEKVHAFAGEAARASFTFGRGYGNLEAYLVAAGIKTREVRPQEWIRAASVSPRKKGEAKPKFKERIRAKCQKMFPSLELWDETLTKQRACCDAILIAEYLRRSENAVEK